MNGIDTPEASRVQAILEQDRIWSAYALADLDPEHKPFTEWHVQGDSLLLYYRGLEPPVLFAIGGASQLELLFASVPVGKYQISVKQEHLASLPANRYALEPVPMWRMWMRPSGLNLTPGIEVDQLHAVDEIPIARLYNGRSDAPDGYHARQLALGPFAGIRDGKELVATAGVHVLSTAYSIAAIGNIYTHPAHRGKGFARACANSVLTRLFTMGIETVVLNVAQHNMRAYQLYSSLGFKLYGPFVEGCLLIQEDEDLGI